MTGLDYIPIRSWNDCDAAGVPRGKAPRDFNWLGQSYTRQELDIWVAQGGNLGVRLAHDMLVIDIDSKRPEANGATADEILLWIELEFGIDLSAAPRVRTGSGGLHIYLRKPADLRIRQRTDHFGPLVEWKTRGTQVLAAGSRHPSGNYYVLEHDGEIPLAPAALLEVVRRERAETDAGPAGPPPDITPACLALYLGELDPELFRDYETWRNLMFSAHHATGGSQEGADAFIAWSTSDPRYRKAGPEIQSMWEAASAERSEARTGRTLFWTLMEHAGGVPPGPPEEDFEPITVESDEALGELVGRPLRYAELPFREWKAPDGRKLGVLALVTNVMIYLEWKYRFEHDAFRDHFLIDGQPLTDHRVDILTDEIRRMPKRWKSEVRTQMVTEACRMAALNHSRHPVREYLRSLSWDGVPRLDTWLIQCSDAIDTPYARAVSRVLLYAAVGRVMAPGVKYDMMVVLEGPQGGRKSSLIRLLGGKWTAEGLPQITAHNHQALVQAMQGAWLIELPELSASRRSDTEVLKDFLSRTVDRTRLPYEHFVQEFPRQCVFIGSTNSAEYMQDSTGGRRFLPLYVGSINLDMVPRDQLWAEAAHVWTHNPSDPIIIPQGLWTDAAVEQEDRRISDPWEDSIAMALKEVSEISTDSLLFEILHRSPDSADLGHMHRLGRVMQKLGWHRTRLTNNDGRRVRGYRRIP